MKWMLLVISFLLSATCQAQSGEIKCTIVIDTIDYKPLQNISVQVYEKEVLKVSGLSDEDGIANIKPLFPGRYNVSAIFSDRDTAQVRDVIVQPDKTTSIKISLQQAGQSTQYKVPPIEKQRFYTNEQIEQMLPAQNPAANSQPKIYHEPNLFIRVIGHTAKVQVFIKNINSKKNAWYDGELDSEGKRSIFLWPNTYFVYIVNANCNSTGTKKYKVRIKNKPIKLRVRVKECKN